MQTMKASPIYSRRSIRKFSDKSVPIGLIDEMLDAGRMAPSAKNRQPWKYIVFGNEKKEELLYHMKQGLIREKQGTLWIANTCFAYIEIMEYLKISGQLVGAVAVGYADERPVQRQRKETEEIVTYQL